MVMTAGTMLPTIVAVRSLYSLQKPMMLMPCWPRAGPIGCAGVALPAGICSLTTARTLFAMCAPLRSLGAGARLVDPRTGPSAPSLALQRPARRHTSPAVQDTSFYYRIPSKVAAPSASPSIPDIQKPACHRTARRLLTALQSREKPVLHFLHLQEVQLDGG